MDLIRQFPDISTSVREKARINRARKATTPSVTHKIEKTRAQMHEHEFRKWHVKLLFMMIIILTGIYLLVLNSPWMFNLVNSVQIYGNASLGYLK